MVGDDLNSDIEGAQALGIKTVLYEFGKQENSNVNPDYTVQNFSELLNLIQEL
jgi:FMN phosphatase YigB (HAD superfamily)